MYELTKLSRQPCKSPIQILTWFSSLTGASSTLLSLEVLDDVPLGEADGVLDEVPLGEADVVLEDGWLEEAILSCFALKCSAIPA